MAAPACSFRDGKLMRYRVALLGLAVPALLLAQQPDQPQSERPSGGLGEQQAEQLLNSAARDERGVQGKKQKQTRPPPRGGRDW